jgi:hypothetical protein
MLEFFYAYVDNGSVPFNASTHAQKDERVYLAEFMHNEGEFATLRLLVKNPKVGLLNPGRKQWVWFSYSLNGAPAVPLFLGRLEGLPSDLHAETISLVYKAAPADFEEQKLILAETLKVYPFYDPIWFNPEQRSNPENVLQARSARWHIDPVTHDISISDFVVGEDGTVNIDVDEQYYPSLRFGYSGVPLTHFVVEATVDWSQTARGAIDLKRQLQLAFKAAGSKDGLITSFTGQGLEATWPMTGDRIGGGWAFGLSYAGEPKGASTKPPEDEQQPESRYTRQRYQEGNQYGIYLVPNQSENEDGIVVDIINAPEENPSQLEVFFSLWKFNPPYFDVAYDVTRARKEIMRFSVVADIQPIIVGADKSEQFAISSSNVAEDIDGSGLPLTSHFARRYFDTDRGKHSLEWLIALARARILYTARAVRISCDVPFSKFLEMSCRKNALIIDDRMPGGQAGGKIIGYGFSISRGELRCSVDVAGTIGKGNELPDPSSGIPVYVQEDYVDGYQRYTGLEIVAIDDAITYPDYEGVIDDDGVNFNDMRPETIIDGARAEAVFTLNQLPVALSTVTIAGALYTWKAAADAPNAVRIGYTTDDSITNLICAVLALEGFAGLRYGEGTIKNPNVTARLDHNTNAMSVIAVEAGTAANSFTVSATGAGASWSSPTLVGGLPKPKGLKVENGESVQADVLGQTYEDIESAEKALNDVHTKVKMQLINLVGGPFETIYDLGDLSLMVQKTVDLEADALP